MKKVILLICFVFFLKTYSQSTSDLQLVQTLEEIEKVKNSNIYSSDKTETIDSLWIKFVTIFEKTIESNDPNKIQNLLKHKNRFEIFTIKETENKEFTMFSISKNFREYWNYVVLNKPNQNQKIVLKETNTFIYFTEIYALNANEFLLIEKMDDMSFSCYTAKVFEINNLKTVKKIAFINQSELKLCSWTNVDESYPGKRDSETGLFETIGGVANYNAEPIEFQTKNKTISYQFMNPKNGKKETRKAKYKKGNFKIESYDVRNFID